MTNDRVYIQGIIFILMNKLINKIKNLHTSQYNIKY